MSNPPYVDTAIVATARELIRDMNPNLSVELVVIAVAHGSPPTVVSSVDPDSTLDVMKFCVKYHHNATTSQHGEPTRKEDLN